MSDIVLIGPFKAGKTTVAKLLAERLGRPHYDLAAESDRYHEAHGITWDEARSAYQQGGFEGWYRFLRPYDAAAVARGLAEHPGSVTELGALQVTYDDEAHQAQAREALRGRAVVLLQPSPDIEEAARELERRQQITYNGQELIEYFARHPANRAVAKQIVYTQGRTPDQSTDDVLAALDPSDATVVLIGPIGAGKSSVGGRVAERLGRPRVALDEVRWDYYKEIGWSEEEQRRRGDEAGAQGVLSYWKPFEVHAVARVLADHPGSVIDFGAGHSVYDDPAQMAAVAASLAPLRNVVLLQPSPDDDESVAILRERNTNRIGGVELNRYLLTHPGPRELATHTVYTDGKAPEATADEILALLPEDAP